MGRILVVDDEEGFRRTVAKPLVQRGHTVSEASNIDDGLRLALDWRPDLIISDVRMEAGDGLSLLRAIRGNAQVSTIPFVLMTGHPDSEGMLAGAEEAVDGYLPKPFTVQTLIATVEKRLAREESLRSGAEEIKEQLQRILEASPDLIGIVDPVTLRFQFLNAAGRKLLELADDTYICATSLESLYPPESVEVFKQAAIPAALSRDIWAGETTLLSSTGRRIPVKQFFQTHADKHGKVTFLSTIAHDLTERQNIEVQLRQAQKLESIGQLAAGIAHEINTPTQYIGDNTHFLKDAFVSLAKVLPEYEKLLFAAKKKSISEELIAQVQQTAEAADVAYLLQEIPQAIQQSLEGVDRVTRIVRAMKDFSHPGTAEKTLLDLNHAIESTVTVARNEWKYVAELDLQLEPELPLVPCLPGEFNQAILNLLINAAHAISDVVGDGSQGKGTITVQTRRVDDFAEIRITDTGGGIPEKIRSRIFEPFFTTKQVGKGTGQGLAMARSVVVDKHAGAIDFESVPGKGATFIIRLPLGGAGTSKATP